MEITTRGQRIKDGWTRVVYRIVNYLIEANACDVDVVETMPSGLAVLNNFDKTKLEFSKGVETDLIGERYACAPKHDLLDKFRPISIDSLYKN